MVHPGEPTMDLPFAVDIATSGLQKSETSLLIASSQESLLPTEDSDNCYEQTIAKNIANSTSTPQYHENGFESVIEPDMEIIDFTQYVNVTETDVDEVDISINQFFLTGQDMIEIEGDVLSLLMSGNAKNGELVISRCEEANQSSQLASNAKKIGDLTVALQHHLLAAKAFRDAAVASQNKDISLSTSLLLLSQSQAKSALSLKKFIGMQENNAIISKALTQKERLRLTVRGALVTNKEADISDSIFLGKATKGQAMDGSKDQKHSNERDSTSLSVPSMNYVAQNPVDEMLKLETELKQMDSALELGNSLVSLGTRSQNRLKQSTMDGSFMVVPPGSSYMSSSAMWSRPRMKANRVQNILEGSTVVTQQLPLPQPTATMFIPNPPQRLNQNINLDASWWGNTSTTSQVLAGSVISIASKTQQESNSTKQLMRLLESIKTLGDENAALLREVEDAETARMEVKVSREQMKRFKSEYGKRFNALKSALENFRKSYTDQKNNVLNPVTCSEYINSHAVLNEPNDHRKDEQITRQEQLIRKLTVDLKKEKDESKKKDAALRKYESFYREVKARSAEKARQREAQQQRRRVPNDQRKN